MPTTTAPASDRPSLGARLSRLPSVMVSSRVRQVAFWSVVALGLGGVAFANGSLGIARTPPSVGVRIGLDLVAVFSVALAYLLLTGRRRQRLGTPTEPIRVLWRLLLLAVLLLGAEFSFSLLVEGAVDAKSRLPMDLPTALVAGSALVTEALFVAALLAGLRTLVLYRRKPLAVGLWRGLLLATLLLGLITAGMLPSDDGRRLATAFVLMLGSVFALACAFRQGWVGALSLRQRAIAAAAAALLGGALTGLFALRVTGGAARFPIADALMNGRTLAYSASVSVPVDLVIRLVLIAGVLYTLTATLVLLFQLPTSEALAQRAGERRAMRSLVDLSGQGLDVDSISQAVALAPVEAGLADAAWVALPDPDSGTLTPRIASAHPLSTQAASGAADHRALADGASGEPLVIEHAAADHRIRTRPGSDLGSLVALRLGTGPEAGTLIVARRSPEAFQPDDVAALETFAAHAGLTLANARLFASALERENLEREMALAREVQQRLLPETLPEVAGARLAAIEKPAQTVGGDYYDAVTIDDHCLGIIVADVSGKGAGAAFYMAEMKGIFQAASRLTRSPSEFLCRANEALSPSLKRGAFVSAIYGVLDAEAGTLSLARAGHCPALVVRAAPEASGEPTRTGAGESAVPSSDVARRTEYVRPDGLALGLDRGPLFERTLAETQITLAAGDVVILFTDGLVEARDASGEGYGYDRLADAAARLCARMDHCDPAALRDALLDDVARFSGHPETDDDVTVVVVAWDGLTPA
ncbi:PP2C family protein-serine/threonine phosphatase [Rubricoccus marinus]|uniref:PPM-type phosphatase domain-containing protein n=1 Tax=Rubricoccus marinus TaxID=716817 RepID=A0A259U147_9BACT|nr:GAF domain-containing SpoIIE family protein phosphatase [Rubricoccus marinus]OZC03577.1 hypothetical protein BSZ36_11650 [Rubricoccus marinus]